MLYTIFNSLQIKCKGIIRMRYNAYECMDFNNGVSIYEILIWIALLLVPYNINRLCLLSWIITQYILNYAIKVFAILKTLFNTNVNVTTKWIQLKEFSSTINSRRLYLLAYMNISTTRNQNEMLFYTYK